MQSIEERIDSIERVHEVQLHDAKARYNKRIGRVLKSQLPMIIDMLSDGDEFHDQILEVVRSMKEELISCLPDELKERYD
jgi:hypothetical protein|tara:strand:- start:85 stop:324 length:240 start_codon:yes stop_codon:yes gene_type:complete